MIACKLEMFVHLVSLNFQQKLLKGNLDEAKIVIQQQKVKAEAVEKRHVQERNKLQMEIDSLQSKNRNMQQKFAQFEVCILQN